MESRDWSSDVCSSDLRIFVNGVHHCVRLEKLCDLGFCFAQFGVQKTSKKQSNRAPKSNLRSLSGWKFCIFGEGSREPTARAVGEFRSGRFEKRAACPEFYFEFKPLICCPKILLQLKPRKAPSLSHLIIFFLSHPPNFSPLTPPSSSLSLQIEGVPFISSTKSKY